MELEITKELDIITARKRVLNNEIHKVDVDVPVALILKIVELNGKT